MFLLFKSFHETMMKKTEQVEKGKICRIQKRCDKRKPPKLPSYASPVHKPIKWQSGSVKRRGLVECTPVRILTLHANRSLSLQDLSPGVEEGMAIRRSMFPTYTLYLYLGTKINDLMILNLVFFFHIFPWQSISGIQDCCPKGKQPSITYSNQRGKRLIFWDLVKMTIIWKRLTHSKINVYHTLIILLFRSFLFLGTDALVKMFIINYYCRNI